MRDRRWRIKGAYLESFPLQIAKDLDEMMKRGTSPRPSPHLTPLPLSNAEREKRSLRLAMA